MSPDHDIPQLPVLDFTDLSDAIPWEERGDAAGAVIIPKPVDEALDAERIAREITMLRRSSAARAEERGSYDREVMEAVREAAMASRMSAANRGSGSVCDETEGLAASRALLSRIRRDGELNPTDGHD